MRKLSLILLIIFVALFVVFYVVPVFRGDIRIVSAFSIGPVRIRLYGLVAGLSLLLGYFVISRYAKKKGLDTNHIDSAFPWIVILGFLGARIYYVVFEWEHYRHALAGIFKIWQGGLSIYGAILGGIIGSFIYTKRAKISFVNFLDTVVLGVPLAQSLGRWGNFFNQEAFGRPTELPWRMYVEPLHRPFEYLGSQFFHPTFLYESLWDLFVFLMLVYLSRSPHKSGYILGSYLVLYSLGRFFIEGLRLDSSFILGLRIDQIVSLVLIVIGAMLILYGERSRIHQK